MEKFKCRCAKMLFEITDKEVIIKCRHCKRYIIVHTQGIDQVEFANNIYPEMFQENSKKIIVAHL